MITTGDAAAKLRALAGELEEGLASSDEGARAGSVYSELMQMCRSLVRGSATIAGISLHLDQIENYVKTGRRS